MRHDCVIAFRGDFRRTVLPTENNRGISCTNKAQKQQEITLLVNGPIERKPDAVRDGPCVAATSSSYPFAECPREADAPGRTVRRVAPRMGGAAARERRFKHHGDPECSTARSPSLVDRRASSAAIWAPRCFVHTRLPLSTMFRFVRCFRKTMVDAATIQKIEEGFAKLQAAENCHSLLKKYLTKEVMDKLKDKKTSLGATLLDVIQSGVANLDSGVGVYAPDAESYTLFKDLFDPIIEDYHNGFGPEKKQPATDLGEDKIAELADLDPEGKYINSTRIRCGRSLQGYPFNPCLTEANYLEMQGKVKKVFEEIKDGELEGTYYPLDGMTKEVQNQLIQDHFLFKEGDRFLQEANACRYWPKGRGIYHNKDKTFLVWVNEEDHLRIISMQQGGNVGQVLGRLIKGAKAIQEQAPFSRDERLGWLTFCPSNLGTTVRASVHIKLPKTSARPDFKKICDDLKLQIRGIHGEHSESAGGVYDISNKARLGLTEFEAVKQMYDGVKHLIELEKSA
uniref:arginine kinase n=1 Tax=Steinernema glaseri TaxID=37863 RepID=A0A1I8AMB2_9BILA